MPLNSPSPPRPLTALLVAGSIFLSMMAPAILRAQDQRDDPAAEAERIDQQIEAERQRGRALEAQARQLAKELEYLRLQLVSVGRDARERETLILTLERQITGLEAEAERRRVMLAEQYRQLTGTLAALTGLSEDAPRAFFLYPGPPLDAVRGSMLLSSAAPAIGERAATLREDLAALDRVRDELALVQERLGKEEPALEEDKALLQSLLDQKRALYESTTEQSRGITARLQSLTEKSQNLRELVAALREEQDRRMIEELDRTRAEAGIAGTQPALSGEAPLRDRDLTVQSDASRLVALAALPTQRPEGLRTFPDNGTITAPAVGRLMLNYGQDTGFGQTAKGIVVETRQTAQILAPFDGKAVFAGPFRDLGNVLILEHEGGYHTVLAGFARIDVADGHWVLAGEPVGAMPAENISTAGPASGARTGPGTRPRLYMELRRAGQPVNPLRWVTTGSITAQG